MDFPFSLVTSDTSSIAISETDRRRILEKQRGDSPFALLEGGLVVNIDHILFIEKRYARD